MHFINADIFCADGQFRRGDFTVENGKFSALFSGEEDGIDLSGKKVLPGFIDVHTHGNSGCDFSDGDAEGLARMAEYYAENGITSFAPASMTLPYETLEKAFAAGKSQSENRKANQARLMGINMEGPFFSEKKKGAQNGAYLKAPDFDAFRRLFEGYGGLVRIVDLAPELPGAAEFTRQARDLCTVSVAHTDATYEEAKAVFQAGATHLTHLFNAMPPIHHRKPGVIGAAAENDTVTAELIGDGLHVHESVIRMAFKLFPGRICLISDSLRCCGMPDGEYELGGQTVYLKDGSARLADGTIAGSSANLFECFQRVLSFGIAPEAAIAACTSVPAREIGREAEIGSIEIGKYADFLVCDADYSLCGVYVGGEKI